MHLEWKAHNTHMNTINKNWACLNPQIESKCIRTRFTFLFFSFLYIFFIFSPMWICQWQLFSAHSKQNTYKIDTLAVDNSIATVAALCFVLEMSKMAIFNWFFNLYAQHAFCSRWVHSRSFNMSKSCQQKGDSRLLIVTTEFESMVLIVWQFLGRQKYIDCSLVLLLQTCKCYGFRDNNFTKRLQLYGWLFVVPQMHEAKIQSKFRCKKVLMTWINDGTCILNRSFDWFIEYTIDTAVEIFGCNYFQRNGN